MAGRYLTFDENPDNFDESGHSNAKAVYLGSTGIGSAITPTSTPTPGVTPTPTTTPTPTVTPTPTPSPAPSTTGGGVQTTGGDTQQPLPGSVTATPTPTPTSSATATPAPTPTPTPTLPPVAGFTNGVYSPQSDSVVDAVNQVTSSGNPLMQRAAGIGAAVANSRGLQNSSIAAQSAQKSALDAAVPIASQEASQANQKNLQYMQGQTSTGIAKLEADNQRAVQQLQNDNTTSIAHLQSDTQKQIATQGAAGQAQGAFAQALLAASQSYSANVSAIMSNPDIAAAARSSALASASQQRDADYTMIQRVYGVSLGSGGGLTWSGSTTMGG